MELNLQALRENYARSSFDISHSAADPIRQFIAWFEEAQQAQLPEPNAMTLATATLAGRPSARTVLLKQVDQEGFVFFTNYESAKGQDLAENPQAALVFLWLELQRQVRITGEVAKISAQASTEYFQSRPKGSQIGAWASPQSQIIEDRDLLEQKVAELNAQYADSPHLPLPPHWGGYLLVPDSLEFWQGRTNRLHDRVHYSRQADNSWHKVRLAP